MMLQAALNGDFTKERHPAMPESVEELIRDAFACVAAGAGSIHLHPRDASGREQLDATVVDDVVRQVRDACGVPVGVTTGAWIEPDLARRLALIREWREPDYTSVNLSEEGALEVMETLLEIGVGIEAGVWTVEDAELLGESGLGNRVTRILVEPGELQVGESSDDALALVEQIHQTLDRFGITVPRLQHADGRVTWPVLADSVRRGIDTRVGLEDTVLEPNGERTTGNAALILAARAMGAGAPTPTP
ncbi:MAG TPA: 3-keto-5-aminohexanoate cleavage protein [Nitrolancea sp.]